MSGFTHLHVHTARGSRLDGLSHTRELFEVAKSHGQTALAITDHGSTASLWEAQKIGDELGMKVIHGLEFYYERENDGNNGHLLILAKNDVGLRNIFKMQEYSYVHNFYKNPRINWDVLKAHSEGLIVTSACLGSPFNQYIMAGDISGATAWARKFKDVFGEDFYIEIQPNEIPEQHTCNLASIRIARQLGIRLVATNDVHYTYETDCFPHEVLLAIQVKKKMSDENRFKFPTEDFWLKSELEMLETFKLLDPAIVREALNTTKEIESKCNAKIVPGKYLPTFYNVPEGKTEGSMLADLAREGLVTRGLNTHIDFETAMEGELKVIEEEGYSGYFLIVQDYIMDAKLRGEPVGDGRGSGAGSKVSYTSGITEIPPHDYDLLFERFMSKGREPDIDTDFSDQDSVFRDLQEKYGEDAVARIVAFGTLTPKSCIRRVFSAFDHPAYLIKEINSYIPDLCRTLDEAYKINPELLTYKTKHPLEWSVIERLQNITSHTSTHAAGVIIYPDLSSLVPLITTAEDRSKRVVGWDMDMLHDLGFYKFDILGLETLKIVKGAVESIKHTTGFELDLTTIDLEDDEVYRMLRNGDVSGVFQIANQAQKVMEQAPTNFRDLIAINALIRPGVGDWDEYIARRRGKEWSVYEPRMSYLEETVGTFAYQEQYLLDGHILAGWDIAYADKHLRKNKDIRNDTMLQGKFLHDCVERGHDYNEIGKVWEEIMDVVDGGYGFPKAHSTSYARLSFITAYLKHYYPEHFYASMMTSAKTDGDGQDEISGYIAECKQRGIAILPPHINESTESFVVNDSGINYRITTIKHVGDSAIAHINELRPIHGFEDFMARREKSKAKKNVVINLIKAGAFDFDNPNRAELLHQFDMAQRTKTQIKNDEATPIHPYDDKVKAAWEQEVLGMYLSVHPLEKYGFQALDTFDEGDMALQGGEIYDMRVFNDKNDNEMAFVHINTLFGNVKLLLFSRTWANKAIRECMNVGNVILVRGKRSGNDMMVDSAEVLEGLVEV